MARPLSIITEAEYGALSTDERLVRGRQAERYRRAGNESSPHVRAVKDRIHQGEGCALCDSASRASVDHIIPIIRGGTHDPENLRILCGSCNSRKGGRA